MGILDRLIGVIIGNLYIGGIDMGILFFGGGYGCFRD